MKLVIYIFLVLAFLKCGGLSYLAFMDGRYNAMLGWAILSIAAIIASSYYGHEIEKKK